MKIFPPHATTANNIATNEPMNINEVTIAGNLTRDPEMRYTPKGTAICKFGVAVNRTWRGEDGNKKEEVTFIDVDAFGKQAEAIAQYLKKGRGIYVRGRFKLEEWEDKTTKQKRSKLGVVLDSFQFIDSKQTDAAPAPRPQAAPVTQPIATPPESDDVPF